jgi:hypothetical protein
MPQEMKQIAIITRVTASNHSAVGEVISGVSLLSMMPNCLFDTMFLMKEPCSCVEVFRLAVGSVGVLAGRPLCRVGWRVMETDRVEIIARALCRSAGFDPDALLPPEMDYALMSPAREPLPAWRRFRRAAEVYCDARVYELASEPVRRLAASSVDEQPVSRPRRAS